jgi:proprotein convertase subtilisin/kexin type 5
VTSEKCTDCYDGFRIEGMTCIQCSIENCATCDATYCSACDDGFFLSLSGLTCSDACPTGYYADEWTGNCEICHDSCTICDGPLPSDCSACKANDYYFDTGCNPCNYKCLTCSGGNDDECSACHQGFYLEDTTCSAGCSEGQFPNPHLETCEDCPTGCTTCRALELCTACDDGYEFSDDGT